MVYKIVIEDKNKLPYNLDIDFSENKFINMQLTLDNEEVGYLIGFLKDKGIFKLDSIYVHSRYRNLGIGSEMLKVLYSLIEGYIIMGNFLPFDIEEDIKDYKSLEENVRYFYQKNRFSLSNNMIIKPVSEYESNYKLENDEIKRTDAHGDKTNSFSR